MTVDEIFAEIRTLLHKGGIETPAQDARLLIAGILDLPTAALIARGAALVEPEVLERIRAAAVRRLAHEPVHRILGARAFFGLTFQMSAETLEPRPDTEVLVERLLPHAERMLTTTGRCRILDLGTGTGAICLSLLSACPEAEGVGTDISEDALQTAAANAGRLGLGARFATIRSDWFEAIDGRFDIVVSNPPYIATAVIDTLAPDVRLYDPVAALDGGVDGLDAYRSLASRVDVHLSEGGVIGLEIGYDQRASVTKLFAAHGFVVVDAAHDLGGRDRALVLQRSETP